jgi:hypothetical protein
MALTLQLKSSLKWIQNKTQLLAVCQKVTTLAKICIDASKDTQRVKDGKWYFMQTKSECSQE